VYAREQASESEGGGGGKQDRERMCIHTSALGHAVPGMCLSSCG